MSKTERDRLTQRLLNPKSRREAFEEVVRQYSEMLYWKIRRVVMFHEDADDVLQNTLMKAWTNLDSFRGDCQLTTWLCRIAINESLDHLRKNQQHADSQPLHDTLLGDAYFDGDKAEAMLQEAIAELPDVQRTVFTMRYYDEMKYSEISQILNTSEGALKASYHIAVNKIKIFLGFKD